MGPGSSPGRQRGAGAARQCDASDREARQEGLARPARRAELRQLRVGGGGGGRAARRRGDPLPLHQRGPADPGEAQLHLPAALDRLLPGGLRARWPGRRRADLHRLRPPAALAQQRPGLPQAGARLPQGQARFSARADRDPRPPRRPRGELLLPQRLRGGRGADRRRHGQRAGDPEPLPRPRRDLGADRARPWLGRRQALLHRHRPGAALRPGEGLRQGHGPGALRRGAPRAGARLRRPQRRPDHRLFRLLLAPAGLAPCSASARSSSCAWRAMPTSVPAARGSAWPAG